MLYEAFVISAHESNHKAVVRRSVNTTTVRVWELPGHTGTTTAGGHGKVPRQLQPENILHDCPLTSRPRAHTRNCDARAKCNDGKVTSIALRWHEPQHHDGPGSEGPGGRGEGRREGTMPAGGAKAR